MEEILAQLMPYIISILVGGATLLVSLMSVAKLKLRVKSLEQYFAEDEVNDYFIVCPNCGHKVILGKIKIYTQLKAQTKAEEEAAKTEEENK